MPFHHILRIFLNPGEMDRRVDDIIQYCRRTGCQEVLLFTSSYDQAPSFASLAEIEAFVTELEPKAQRLREAGIVVSVNVLQTVGHIYFPEALEKRFPFRRRVYSDGSLSKEGACPLGADLRKWVVDSYRIYARLKPRVMFVDDDFRALMQGLSCFCDEHLKLISQIAAKPATREEVVAAIHGKEPGADLREAYWKATTRGFSEMAALIQEVVHSISPATRLGGMSAEWPVGAIGQDWEHILKVLAGPHQPLLRPQIAIYSEGFLRDMPRHFFNPSCFRATLPSDVEFWPEIENYQYGAHAKSAQCTFVQIASLILQGFDHCALNVFDMYGASFSDHEELIALLERKRSFLSALNALVPEGTRPQGVKVLQYPEVNSCPPFFGEPASSLRQVLPNLGLPVCHDGPSPWALLLGRDAAQLSDVELDSILKQGAVLDALAVSVLANRGFSERIGVTAKTSLESDDLGYEEFISPLTSPGFHHRCFPLRALIAPGDWKKLDDLTGHAIEASVIRNYSRAKVGAALLLTENKQGERFGILAWDGQGDRHLIENRMRAEQLRMTFKWIARKSLPCTSSPKAAYLWTLCTRTREGHLVLGLINLSTDTYEKLPLIFGAKDSPKQIQQLDDSGELLPTKISHQEQAGEEITITLPVRLAPLEMAVFVGRS